MILDFIRIQERAASRKLAKLPGAVRIFLIVRETHRRRIEPAEELATRAGIAAA